MILSGADVLQYIRYGGLEFVPELNPDQFQQNGIDMILHEAETSNLEAGEYVLGRTRELIVMPNDLCAQVELRSTWARKGFFLPPTVIDAGFRGTITLEIGCFKPWYYRGKHYGISLPLGQRFAHIVFQKLTSPSEPYSGKYQKQVAITHAIEDGS